MKCLLLPFRMIPQTCAWNPGRPRPPPDGGTAARRQLVVLVGELVLPGGLLGNGHQAGSAPGVGAGGADGPSPFTQLTGESGVVDLLQVLLDLAPGVFQELRLTLEVGRRGGVRAGTSAPFTHVIP